ncbi:deleted in malignant brain tumors 1 protein-like isoform X1 [Lytechinus variegatus]|uniref:deleted in malignant brain tumors 1 protein-like isoform X1 n=1 Tax=Lytechinus variegatus TaxID=7654 RepID=UPI001BB1454B|nr:deleted in malignant brain tumors 1 protein-like isoform X1 [Lytechinus variegatus]
MIRDFFSISPRSDLGGYCQGRCDLGFLESGSCFCDVYCREFDDCCDDYEYHCTQVRLRDGSSYIEGRVEVLHGGIWGTVCDNSWDIEDARVICKSIGYPGVEGAFSDAAFGEGTGDIILDNVECTGEEWNIFHCPHNGLGVHNCSHADDAGVRCSLSNEENVTIIPGEKQKLESPNYLGNYYDNTVYIWLITAPPGYHVLITFLSMSLPPCGDHMTIGTGYSPTSPDSVQLAFISGHGEPDDIRLYTPTGWIQFSSDDSGISDGFVLELNSINSTAAPARLANGSYPNEGRVEVYSNSLGTWGTICDSGWDHQDASVVCRSMGYPDAVASYGGALFGMGSGPVLMGNVSCNGTENSVFYCPYGSGDTIDECEHSEDAGVVCYPNVRLLNGDSPSEGRVEVYHDGQWGTVCESYWGINETRVLCRSLGFPGTLAYFPDAYFGEGTGDILLMVRSCDGDEDSIFDCCHYGLGYHDRDRCGHYADVGVRCQSNVRLVNGNSSNEGRVEVYHGDKWGTVCDSGWGLEEAGVICKSLGYPGALQALGNGSFGQGSGDILLDEVDCIGDESSIFYCSHDGVGVSSCSHGEDAGVRCALETSTPHYPTSLGISTSAQTSSEIIETTRSYSTESDTAATVVTSDTETTRYVEEITTTWTTTEMNLITTPGKHTLISLM